MLKFKPGQIIKWISFKRRDPNHKGKVLAYVPAGEDLCSSLIKLGLRYEPKPSSVDVARTNRYLIREQTNGLILVDARTINRKAKTVKE